MDKIRVRLTQQRKTRDCCALIFTESCLDHNIPDQAIARSGRTVFRAELKTPVRQGEADSVRINDACCSNVVRADGQCSPDVEFLVFNVKTPTILSTLCCCCCLLPSRSKVTMCLLIYVLCVYSMKGGGYNFNVIVQRCVEQ